MSKTMLKQKYEEVTVINKGSYGLVSLVKDISTGKLYAAKCIGHDEINSPTKESDRASALSLISPSQSLADGRYEIDVHRRLGKHPNILELVDHFEENGCLYLILEYCSGGDLYEAIRQNEIFYPRERVRDLMNQLITILEYCHGHGIYHRDIKPENILISSDGTFKLADWGLATDERECTEFGVGSRQYMAPECFDSGCKYYDPGRADIWALGICLLNVLFGRNPFKVADQRDRLFTDFAANRESLFDIFPALSQDVFDVLRYSLTLDPSNRSLAGMRAALAKVEIWTTDEEFDMIDAETDAAPLPKVDVMNITTDAERPPFRVPSGMAVSASPLANWDRRMQFTPPVDSATLAAKFRRVAPSHRWPATSRLRIDEEDEDDDNDEYSSSSQGSPDESRDGSRDGSLDRSRGALRDVDESIFSMDGISPHSGNASDSSDSSDLGSGLASRLVYGSSASTPGLEEDSSGSGTHAVSSSDRVAASAPMGRSWDSRVLAKSLEPDFYPRSWADEEDTFLPVHTLQASFRTMALDPKVKRPSNLLV